MSTQRQLTLLTVLVGIAALLLTGGAAGPVRAAGSLVADSVAASIGTAHLAEPLVRTAPTAAAEDLALARAVTAYERRAQPEDVSSLTAFLSQNPRSGWASAVWTNLGLSYLHDGYFSRALDAWRRAWALGKDATDPQAKAMVDRAVGELARLYASLGQFDRVAALFKEVGKRPISGSATEAWQEAGELLSLTTRDPRHLFNCGPVGLKLLMLSIDLRNQNGEFLQFYRAGPKGTSLAELGGLADKAKFSYRLVFRKPGQPMPMQALVHWKVGHYSAIIGKANGRYRLQDPIFPGSDLWVTQAALDAEASGYFLVAGNAPVESGWRGVGAKEAAKVWGKGPTSGTQPGAAGQRDRGAHAGPHPSKKPRAPGADPGKPPKKPDCGGMCGYDIRESSVGVTLADTPVGYEPPVGPAATVTITYNQREDSQPANFNYFNVSPKWTLNWLTYVTDDPANPGANVSRYLPEGGAYYYGGYSSSSGRFAAQNDDGSILVLASQGPVSYRRQLSDGSVEVYAQSDGSASYPRKVFLSQVIDPQGNAVALSYDGQLRLTALTDATGRQTTFTYGQPSRPLLVTRITDPFGRAATLSYDATGRLRSITDTIGLTSSFSYDANSLVNSLTTPYGTTTFSYTAPGSGSTPRFVQVTDPLGYHEREEWLEPAPVPTSDPSGSIPQGMPVAPVNLYLEYRDSFYWDKDAYVAAGCAPTGGCDYTKARASHFNHVANASLKSTSLESVKYPLENRIWYSYPAQTNSIYAGNYEEPIASGRVLDDGSTQLYQYSYDTTGYFKLTQEIDPLGRVTSYSYANQIDLAAVSQTTAFGVRTTIAQFTYNTHHQPVLATDAAGQTMAYAYNPAGQLTTLTNALGNTTSYHYNASGDLTSIIDANGFTAATFTHDAFDRIATFTDSEAWTVSYNYDAANRVTRITYPDGTAETYAYDKLDLASYQDRLGRKWTYAYDANRRLAATTDPAGQQTLFAYNGIDKLTALTDPDGHVTQWAYDVEGRLTTKTYADTTTAIYAYDTTTRRLRSFTDALGQVRQYSYAKDDQLTALNYLNAVHTTPNVTFAYDVYFPRLTSMTDGSGTTQYAYVPVGSPGALKLQQKTTPLVNGGVIYAYDALGRVSGRTVQGSGAQTFAYDAIDRLTEDSNDLGSFTLSYLGETSQLSARTLASSTLATTLSYLPNSGDRRLAQISTVGLSPSQHSTFQYTTNAEYETTGSTETSDAAVAYPPDAFLQTASYNNVNQLTSLSGQALTWDANGNLLSDGARTYSWDAENRLVGIAYPGQPGKATAFGYDGQGRRISMSSTPAGGGSAVVTSYIWCDTGLCQARNSGGTVTRAYYDAGEFLPGSPSQSFYYGPDRVGSTRRAFAAGQAPAFDYDPYGKALQATAPVTDFGYAGMIYNADSGLYLATYRAYDPVAGRWLSRDPIGEIGDPAGNLYAYAGGDPVDELDPLGLEGLQFQYYGNYGGPHWTSGAKRSEGRAAGPIPTENQPGYVYPRDAQDRCYEGHDRCINKCPEPCPTHGNPCLRACDGNAHQCLDRMAHKTFGSRAASWGFSWAIPTYVH